MGIVADVVAAVALGNRADDRDRFIPVTTLFRRTYDVEPTFHHISMVNVFLESHRRQAPECLLANGSRSPRRETVGLLRRVMANVSVRSCAVSLLCFAAVRLPLGMALAPACPRV